QERSGGRAIDGNPFVHRPAPRVGHDSHYGRSPEGGDGAVLAGEDETGRARTRPIVHDEASATVEHDAGRRALLAPRARNGEGVHDSRGSYVIERCETGAIVGEPPGRGRTGHKPPRVHYPRISDIRRHGTVGDKVELEIELRCGGRHVYAA